MMTKCGQMSKMKEIFLHFLLMMKIFGSQKIFVTNKKNTMTFQSQIQNVFIISYNPTFEKEMFLNYKKL